MRERKGYSLRTLAGRAEMSYTYLCNLENGKADPSLSTLKKLAKALGATLIELLSDEEPRAVNKKVKRKTQPSASSKKGR
jgi:transcriptional regulator with XRE-family HTH domain